MTHLLLLGARFWLLAAALALALAALAAPRLTLERGVYDVLAAVDLTGSMNTRDMGDPSHPRSRLEAARQTLARLLSRLPCQSRLGLAVFAERRTFLLFAPVEVCANFAALESAILGLDWRMAWEGDSLITKGLFSAIAISRSLRADLIFLTDGHEAPPLPASGPPPFEGKPGAVRGLIVGVGAEQKSPIPKFDAEGHEVGVWGPDEVPHENRVGLPPKDAQFREGYDARNAPFGAAASVGDEHLSSLRRAHIETLAAATGLQAVSLRETPDLLPPLRQAVPGRPARVLVDIRPWPAAGSLSLLMAALVAVPLIERLRLSRHNQKGVS